MKKILALLFTVITIMLFLCPCATVLAQSAGEAKNIHLVAPSAIAYGNNRVFVADNITDGQSAVHIFDVSGNSPLLEATVDFEKPIVRLRYFDGTLYVLSQQSYCVLNTTTLRYNTLNQAVKDVAVVSSNEYFFKNGGIFKNSNTDASFPDDNNSIVCIALNGEYINLLYTTAQRNYNHLEGTSSPSEPINGDVEYFGTVAMQGKIVYFNSQNLFFDGRDILVANNDEYTFLDVAAHGNEIFVLNSNNQVFKYRQGAEGFNRVEGFAIGSDIVEITPPSLSDITSFTLAKPLGYPANIVYRTTQEDSIAALIDDSDSYTFIVLGYDNDSKDDYYYVYVNGAFGWVKKSTTANQSLKDDKKIQVINTSFSDIAGYAAKLMSPNAAFVYHLPYNLADIPSNSPKYTLPQSSTNPTEVELLQQFTSIGQIWYLVRFEFEQQTCLGFVKKGDVGSISSTGAIGSPKILSRMKINATLYDNVNLYLTAELDDQQKTVDPQTQEKIVLSTGTLVNVLTQSGNAAYLQIVYADGTTYYGWVEDAFLVETSALTTNQTVGLILTASAIAIAVVILLIFRVRKKSIKIPTIDLDTD